MIAAAALYSPKGEAGPILGCDGDPLAAGLAFFLSQCPSLHLEVALQKRAPEDTQQSNAISAAGKVCA